jgi:hypothetical protein
MARLLCTLGFHWAGMDGVPDPGENSDLRAAVNYLVGPDISSLFELCLLTTISDVK